MFPELNVALDLDSSIKFIAINERKVDGSFVLHHLISSYLKNGHPVFVVALQQTFMHYYGIAMKLGHNLKDLIQAGKFTFVDGLNLVRECQEVPSSKASENPFSSLVFNSQPTMNSLFNHIKVKFEMMKTSFQSDIPFLFIIDDLLVLLNLGVSLSESVKFLHDCSILCNPSPDSKGCFVPLFHIIEHDENSNILSKYASHNCDLLIDVNALETGFSKDVHGKLKITKMDRLCLTTEPNRYPQLFHFKVEERNVRIFAPGNAPFIL